MRNVYNRIKPIGGVIYYVSGKKPVFGIFFDLFNPITSVDLANR